MDHPQSDPEARLVLLVGAPRSGTTWLQSLLGAHQAIASPQETDLFSRFVKPLHEAWQWQLRGGADGWAARRYKGLPSVLTAEEFEAAVRFLVRATLDATLRMKPGAAVVLEKSPAHSLCCDLAATYAPGCRFVHLVRDGRDVASSLVAAGASWGAGWAPGSIVEAARTWAEHVEGARSSGAAAGDRYMEVRYEDLLGGGPAVLEKVFAFCGVEVDPGLCSTLLDEFELGARSGDNSIAPSILIGGEMGSEGRELREPEGFFGRGGAGGWRDEWSAHDRRAFASVAGDLLVRLGYETDSTWAGPPGRAPLSVRAGAARATARIAGGLARRARSAAERWG